MSHSVQMPALGESVTEGTVTRWLKKEGDAVAEDEPLLEVSTDKVDTEVPAPYAGILEKILVQEDETVAIGAELAIIGSGSDAGSASAAGSLADDVASEAAPGSEAAPAPAPTTTLPGPVAAQSVSSTVPDVAAAPDTASTELSVAEFVVPTAAGTTVTMPVMGESVTEGTITRWLKSVGDAVAEDEPLVEIATDKVDAEVPSPVAGTLLAILAPEDATVEVGAPIATVGAAASAASPAASAASVPEPAPTPPSQAAPVAPTMPAPAVPMPAAPAWSAPAAATPVATAPTGPTPPAHGTGYLTPVVRKLAADHGVDLATVTGTGVGGRIRREDVLAAADRQRTVLASAGVVPASAPAVVPAPAPAPVRVAAATPVPATPAQAARPVTPAVAAPPPAARISSAPAVPAAVAGTTQPAPRIRQAMARSMMAAVTTSAQTTTIIEIDVTRVAALRDRAQAVFRAREGGELTFLPFFVKAAIEAARANPIVNASVSDDLTEITYHPTVDLGITVDTPRGQIVPVIHRADDLGLTGLARRIADLAERTASGALGPDELSGATFTVTNAGPSGALIDTPIVVPPQAAILAAGSVNKRPVVVTDADGNDVIAVRSIAAVALSYDQRIVDGAEAARYLGAVKRRIEDGDFEADLGI